MTDKEISPTIEQSLRMIEDKLKNKKRNKVQKPLSNKIGNKNQPLSNLFKKKNLSNIEKKKNSQEPLLLKNKVDDKGKPVKKKLRKIIRKNTLIKEKLKLLKEKESESTPNLKNYKNLNKTTDLAIIIKKIKKIRDKKLKIYNKSKSKKVYKEIIKLNEAIDLSEDLFKKELLDL